jgi:hypothetical protein
VYSKSSLSSQGPSLTSYSRSSQSALCNHSHLSSVRGHHLQAVHVHPSQHYALKVIALQSGVITYILYTSIPVSTVYLKSSLFNQRSSLTSYSCPCPSALCAQSNRSSDKGHHLQPVHVQFGEHGVLEVIALESRVVTYNLFTSVPISTIMLKVISVESVDITYFLSHPTLSALCTQSHRSSVKGYHLQAIHVHPSQHSVIKVILLQSRVNTYNLCTSIPVSTVHSKSSSFSQGSILTTCPRPSQSALCTQVIALQSEVITYTLSMSIPVNTVCSNLSLFSQGSSLTSYPCPSQSALCTQSHRCRVSGHHLLSITSNFVSTMHSKSSLYSQGSSLTGYPRPP